MTAIEFSTLDQELQSFEAMTEQEAMTVYNVDYKAEALQYILDYWGDEEEAIESESYLSFCYENWN